MTRIGTRRFYDWICRWSLLPAWVLLVLAGCGEKSSEETLNAKQRPLFKLISAAQTGVDFNNTLFESDTLNILNEAYLYNGGGVGIGDFNRDGWVDLYFSANMVSNKLYLNLGPHGNDPRGNGPGGEPHHGNGLLGDLKFRDITEAAGVGGAGKWCSGVSVIDINTDGWLDLYVSATFHKDSLRRQNLLYINQGVNEEGIPQFKEEAAAYGLADNGYSTQGVFFDYDRDGDLDLYMLTNALYDSKTPIRYRPKVTDGTAVNSDRLYRNNGIGPAGHPTFTDVSREAGILIEGWGHAVSVSDINLDGWPDLYISNDFVANDLLYINNQDGTFTDQVSAYFQHTSWFTMGTDITDINNDGLVDVVALDMLPENNLRKKSMLSGNDYINYFNSRKFGYQHQYIRNVLQLNAGMSPNGHPVFSEVGAMAGIHQTDWSWAPLVADFDQDGFRDIIITNGLPRDVTDLDYIVYDNGQDNYGGSVKATLAMVEEYFPVVKIPNYAFKNTGGFLFADSTKAWGLQQPSFSNGGAYADLDNDGDLDLVINNINDPAFIYENTLRQDKRNSANHFLSVVMEGPEKNPQGIGATIRLYVDGGRQLLYEHQPCRGYLSTMDVRAHFGLGSTIQIDSLRVLWPDQKSQLLTRIPANQPLTLSYRDAATFKNPKPVVTPVFSDVSEESGLLFKHREKDAIDYNIQRTLPHKLSQYGPGIAVGDIDQNGYDDLYLGGAAGYAGVFFMQNAKGNFIRDTSRILQPDSAPEEMGVLLFDADNDTDLDLYVVHGSYEFPPFDPTSQDRLYVNNGKGQFQWDEKALPKEFVNGSCVRAADFDQDGDLDLFVGGRSVSGAYPTAPQNFLLENQEGIFYDVTAQYSPALQQAGMITDALWSDFDQDGKVDLVLAGEWMPLTFFKNTGDAFESVNESTGISQHHGWWNSLVSGDFDQDGDIDYVAGNLGLNSIYQASAQEPMTMLAKDVDDNGRVDPMIFSYMKAEDGTRHSFPIHTRDDMISQLISIRREYPTYQSFGRATLEALWPVEEQQNALKMKTTQLASSYIENKGAGKFTLKPLPLEAQIAPLYGMVAEDVDGDGQLDLMLVGNDYGIEPIAGRHDALMGLYLKGDGQGNFLPVSMAESGFWVNGDAKGLAVVHTATGENLWVATQNQDSLKVFRKETNKEIDPLQEIKLNPDDFYADIVYQDKSRRRIEFYYGNTYLSQSSRRMHLDEEAIEVVVTDYQGHARKVMEVIY